MPLIPLVIAWLVGILLAESLRLPLPAVLVASSGGCILAYVWRGHHGARNVLLLVCLLFLGSTRLASARSRTTNAQVQPFYGQQVVFTGAVVQQPDRREERQTVVVATEAVMADGLVQPLRTLVQLRLPAAPTVRYGQRLRVEGRLEIPSGATSFDYRGLLARRGIHAMMRNPDLTLLPGGTAPLQPLLLLNDTAHATVLRLLPEPHASLLIGILLGLQSTLPDDVREEFRTTGTTHIMVISGWNITLVITTIAAVLFAAGLTRRGAGWGALLMVGLFVGFVGGSPAVLRAAVMGSLVVWAELVGRPSHSWTLLFAACGVLTLLDPYALWDLGFQLSALATAGLFAWGEPLRTLLAHGPLRWRGLRWVVEPLASTLAALSLVIPLLMSSFGTVSLVSPLANILLLPAVPFAFGWGVLATVAGLVVLPLGQLLATLSWPFLHWMLAVVHFCARLPGATMEVGAWSSSILWIWYVLVGGLGLWYNRQALKQWKAGMTAWQGSMELRSHEVTETGGSGEAGRLPE